MRTTQQIDDMIREAATSDSPEVFALRLVAILSVLNERLDGLETVAVKAATEASCLANGIRPD